MTTLKSHLRFFTAMLIIEVVAIALAIAVVLTICAPDAKAGPPSRTAAVMPKCIVPRVAPRKGLEVKGKPAGTNQRKVLLWIVNEGHRRHLARVYVIAAIAATTQESSARELRHGEGTSVGPFQLIDSHGSFAERVTIEFSGNWFYNGARKVYRPGMTAAQLAQAVERSGYPTAYRAWVPEARRTLDRILGPCRLPVAA